MAGLPRPRVTAGVLLTRTAPPGGLELAVVHRQRYDDWSLPKGGVEAGEHLTVAAAREAQEETGYPVTLGRRLPKTDYDHAGGSTRVHWWAATVRAGGAGPIDAGEVDAHEVDAHEVDEVRWVDVAGARALLSYANDINLLSELGKRPIAERRVILVRHADAGDRRLWTGADDKRPLDAAGLARASRLAAILGVFGPTSIHTATPLRCVETVEPLAAALALPITRDGRFDDSTWQRGPKPASRAVRELAVGTGVAVVCSQGETIPGVIAELFLTQASKPARSDIRRASNGSGPNRIPRARKGSFWVLSFAGRDLIAADYVAD